MKRKSARAPLSRAKVLKAALRMADKGGIETLSMRNLAKALKVEAMSLYNHVDGKDALLDGIHERILLSLDAPPNSRSWQAFVRHQAFALHRALLAHPHAIPLFATRPAATPAAVERLGSFLEVLDKAGFTPVQSLSIVQLVAQLVIGHAMWTNSVDVVLTPEPNEHLDRALQKWDPDRELAMGIDALLVGFAALL